MVLDVTFRESSQHLENDKLGGCIVHGGAIAAVIDSLAAYTGGLALNLGTGGMSAATAEQSFKYKGPMFVGRRYTLRTYADSREVKPGRSAQVRCAYIDDDIGIELVLSQTLMKTIPNQPRSTARL